MNTIDAGTRQVRRDRRIGTQAVKTALVLAMGGLLVAAPLSAQRGQGPERGPRMGMRGAAGATAILNLRERLELTDAQVAELNTLREAQLEERIERMAEAMRIRSSVAAGELSRSDAREQLRPDRSEVLERAEAAKAEIDNILTIDQREELLEIRTRAVRRSGRAHARRGRRGQDGPVMRGQRGQDGPVMRGRRPGNDAEAPGDGAQEAADVGRELEAIQRVG